MSEIPYPDLVRLAVHQEKLPNFLHKYRTIDSTKKMLENNSMWFSSPKNFNDPFDCQIIPNTNNTESEIRKFLRDNINDLSDSEIDNLAKITFNQPSKWKNTIEKTFDSIINSTGICCFTENPKNLLMWSHYTDCHKGVCLKFNLLKDPSFFVYPLPVNYQDKYPDYNHLGDRNDLIKDIILTKSSDWKYENEIRVMKLNKIGLVPFKKECLEEIIFGYRTEQKDIDSIMELSKSRGFNIEFKRSGVSTFDVTFFMSL